MRDRFIPTYLILVIAQILLCNYFHFTQYVALTMLPAMILCIPTKTSVFWTMIIAFATGLSVDFFSEGLLGINTLALVPIAYFRKPIIEMLCGKEPFEQGENITVNKYGTARVSFLVIILLSIFLSIYIFAECAGTRPILFILSRICASVFVSYLMSMLAINIMTHDSRR